MRKNTQSQSAFFNPRIFAAFLLCSAAAWMTMLSFASTPSSGALTDTSGPLTYTAGPLPPNQTPLPVEQQGPVCEGTGSASTCDSYALTVTLPTGYVAANPQASVQVTLSWANTDPTGNEPSDYDLYIYKGVVANTTGSQQADWQSANPPSHNPEVANITPLTDGTSQYTIKVVGFQPAGETVHVKIELLTNNGGNGGGFPGFGSADPTTPGVPRYQIFDNTTVDAGQGGGQGEFNIGYNTTTHRMMAYNGLNAHIQRVTPAEIVTPGKPECCRETWEDKDATSTGIVGLDPILWTDNWTDANPLPMQPASGARTFVSNSTAGTNAAFATTDNDGDSYLPTSASPPNASSDHETIGSGPYPASLSTLGNPVNHGHAVYYCAQTYPVGGAACQRSDTYGDSFGSSTLMYTGNAGSLCAGIHGHVHVGPDGTVYVPVRDCTGNAGLAVSMDAGTTWTTFSVPNSPVQAHGSDPSIAIDANNTVYFFYISSNPDHTEGHVHVQVSTDHGATWSKDTDLGISHGVINSAFPEAVAGSSGRAACGFLGTDRTGDYENINFPGYWYLFMATTYDGGDSWSVTNLTPNDPVQGKGGIWQAGGSGVLNRNLLDFNEVTMDEKGRVLFGYSDGCTGSCVGDPNNNTFRAAMRVARQIGGKSLLSQFDVAEPVVPKAPCLIGSRDSSGVHLSWRTPDNGGADIVSYNIYRGNASGNEVLLINTATTKTTFNDITADPTQPVFYYVRAVNSVNVAGGTNSQEVNFPATPGIQLLSITSQKTHGSAGTFGINVPLDGSAIECRTPGALPGGAAGDYQLVFDFANNVSSVGSVAVAGAGNPTASGSVLGGNYVVNLSGITNAQKIVVTLTNVMDSAGNNLPSLTAVMGVLIGDVNASKRTDAGDVTQVRNRTVTIPDATTFRFDVNNSGRIDAGDVTTTRNATVTVLP